MELEAELTDLLEFCLTITTTQEETEFLTDLIACLQSEAEVEKPDDDPETCFFREVVQKNPGPNCTLEQLRRYSKSVGLVWKVAEDLDWLLYYVFHRRYGWPDLKEESGYLLVSLPEAQGKFRKSKKCDELRYKSRLVELLDVLIMWLFHQDASLMAIRMYSSAIRLASNAPVTRHQMVIHSLDWLKERLEEPCDEIFEALKDLILLAVTDVWSQVRGAAATRMGPVVDKFSLDQVQNIFEEFARNCEPISNTWQATDGSILALNALIKRFQRVGYIGDLSASMSNASPRIQSQIRFGKHTFDRLPSYIPHRMKSLVFILVNNQQLTIRETVIKAFVNCLNRCSDHESELAFHEVYQRLQSKAMSTTSDGEYENACPILNPNFAFMNPYTAESLLNLCLFLFKRIRDHQSYLENWDIYHNTFDVYLMHPASSVRLATSNLYRYVVARSISNPLLVKNILFCLLRKWQPSQRTLLRPVVDLISSVESDERRVSVTDFDRHVEDEADTWEWREGRLLVYELVCQLLIKNHHLYTFGPPSLAGALRGSRFTGCSPLPSSGPRPGSLEDHGGRSFERKGGGRLSASLSTSDPALNLAKLGWNSAHKHASTDSDHSTILDENQRRSSQQESEMRAINVPKLKLPTMDSSALLSPSAGNMIAQYSQFTTLEPKSRCASFLAHVRAIDEREKDAEARSVSSGSAPHESGSLLPNFRSLLCQMLHTCAECLCDPQWELRRMAKQTFTVLSELLRWFDPSLLADLVNTHLGCNPTLMTYACLTLVRDSLRHTARLQTLVRNPPPSWQGEVAMATVEAVIRSVHDNLAQWLRSCRHYLQRLHFDCVTPITAHVIMLAVIHFSGGNGLSEGNGDLDEEEAELPRLHDAQCHVDAVISMFLRLDSVLQRGAQSDIAVHGFEIYPSLANVPSIGCSTLEFCLHFVEQLGEDLAAFLQSADVISSVHLLPVLVEWLRRIYRLRTDTTDCLKNLVASLGMLACKVVDRAKVESGKFAEIVRGHMERLLVIVSELIEEHVARESWWLRQLLDITIQLLSVIGADFSGLVAAFVRRLRSGRVGRQEGGREAGGARIESNLRLFASEAHPELHHEESDRSEDSEDEAGGFPESLALRRSRLESGTDGRGTISSEPGGSEWDSDSEDDDQNDLQASLRTAGHFLQKLARCQQERFFEQIMALENEDQALVRTVISQNY